MKPGTLKFRFQYKYLFFGLLLFYIIICQSCMTMRTSATATKTYFDSAKVAYTSKTLTIGKHHLHYVATGNQQLPTLFFVHGSPGSWDAFRQYLTDSILLKKFRMIAVDRPGFGNSDFGTAEDLETQAQLLEAVVAQTANGKPIILVGHSLGGPVIVKMAADAPQQFAGLVVLAGSVDPDMETAELWRALLKAKPVRYLIPGALRPSNDELWWLKADLRAMRPQLKNISCEVTIIHGTKDPLVPFGNVAFMQKSFVNARKIDVIAIENANHFIPWEHFDLIRDKLAAIQL